MNRKLLDFYNEELYYLRRMGMEFASQNPKTAKQLDLGRFECADPYVERLLEGFAFLTARVQLKLDAEFPSFTQHLLNIVYPHYLSPTPSMTIVRFDANVQGGVPAEGDHRPRGSRLFYKLEGVRNEFRTSQNVTVWPISVEKADYLSPAEARDILPVKQQKIYSGLRLRLKIADGIDWNTVPLDELVFYLDGGREIAGPVYELLAAHTAAVLVKPVSENNSKTWRLSLPVTAVKMLGFSEEEALLPYTDISFQGYRLLQEYYALPERFLFVQLSGLHAAIQKLSAGEELEITLLFKEEKPQLQGMLGPDNFLLHCTPAINLFPRNTNKVTVASHAHEHHVIVNKNKAQSYEIHSITHVKGFDKNSQETEQFLPFYDSRSGQSGQGAYYTWRRTPSLSPQGKRSVLDEYRGSEIYLSLVNSQGGDYASGLSELSVNVLCTNRDSPEHERFRRTRVGFELEHGSPKGNEIYSIVGPTKARAAYPEGEQAWRLINHLSLNYLSLLDTDSKQGAAALRELLNLYADNSLPEFRRQLEGVLSINSKPIVRRLAGSGPIAFGRGVGIDLHCEEKAFDGLGAFLLGAVLEKFFAKYVSVNSFVQLSLHTSERGEVIKWPVRTGTTPIL